MTILNEMIDIYDNMIIDICIDNKISIHDKTIILKLISSINNDLKEFRKDLKKRYE